jgi:hypothetical protein
VVVVGGVPVTYAVAEHAAEVLAVSRTSAIKPVLKAAGNELSQCDYFDAAAPYLAAAQAAPKTGRIGAAGRHITKNAFIAAISAALARARTAELAAALNAFVTDERYAVAIALEAVAVRERAHAAGFRSAVRSAAVRAVAACTAQAGQFTCRSVSACGTGTCRFAPPEYRCVTAPAAPGRLSRPANHADAGAAFDSGTAAAELSELVPYRVGVLVHDYDESCARDDAA